MNLLKTFSISHLKKKTPFFDWKKKKSSSGFLIRAQIGFQIAMNEREQKAALLVFFRTLKREALLMLSLVFF